MQLGALKMPERAKSTFVNCKLQYKEEM